MKEVRTALISYLSLLKQAVLRVILIIGFLLYPQILKALIISRRGLSRQNFIPRVCWMFLSTVCLFVGRCGRCTPPSSCLLPLDLLSFLGCLSMTLWVCRLSSNLSMGSIYSHLCYKRIIFLQSLRLLTLCSNCDVADSFPFYASIFPFMHSPLYGQVLW